MRVVSWNVNGLERLLESDDWKPANGLAAILEKLQADVLCMQEHHLTQKDLRKNLTSAANYDAFLSLDTRTSPLVLNHYGSATFVKRAACVPLKAEEGIGDVFVRDYLKKEKRIGGYPTHEQVELDKKTMDSLDREGRVVLLDMGLFVLINVYSPNATPDSEARYTFKCCFEKMLEYRVRNLIKQGREVIVCGDLNIAASELDSKDWQRARAGDSMSTFLPRIWLNDITGEEGLLVDMWRKRHPGEQVMSCAIFPSFFLPTMITLAFSTTPARVDYFLITHGLIPWVKKCDIDPNFYGSDHRPILLELHETIETSGGHTLALWEAMNPGRAKNDPRPQAPSIGTSQSTLFGASSSVTAVSHTTPKPAPSASQPSSSRSFPARAATSSFAVSPVAPELLPTEYRSSPSQIKRLSDGPAKTPSGQKSLPSSNKKRRNASSPLASVPSANSTRPSPAIGCTAVSSTSACELIDLTQDDD
ncbi:hypothetical protein JCM11251_004990 [Rhodosporidiobolus azoricus]